MAVLSGLKPFLFLVLLAITFHPSKEKTVSFGRILRFVGASSDVASFAESLGKFFGIGGNSESNAEELTKEIGDLINKSKTEVIAALLETTKLERIYDAVIAMHSSMKDLRQMIVHSADTRLFVEYRQQFIDNFKENELIKHIRFLPELLTYVVPGFDVPLLQQVKRKSKCDHAAINTFREFYVNLITNGIGLQATYEEFTKGVTLETILKTEWQESLDKVQSDFDSVEKACFDELYKRAKNCTSGANSVGISWNILDVVLIASVFLL